MVLVLGSLSELAVRIRPSGRGRAGHGSGRSAAIPLR